MRSRLAVPAFPPFADHPGRNCRDEDPAVFYGLTTGDAARAKAICNKGRDGCPVKAACLAYALEHHEFGVWSGTTELERLRIIAEQSDTKKSAVTEARAARQAAIAALHAEGVTYAEIAKRLGVVVGTVRIDLAEWRRAETLKRWPAREERIEAAVAGEPVELTKPELADAIDAAGRAGLTAKDTALRLRCSPKTVRARRETRSVA